nr:hypothetical protein [Tanacetum cinerariifolium]
MSSSNLGGMALESSKAVVLPKFDMHIYNSELTLEELKNAITEYCIPMDLYPLPLHPGMTMDMLPSRKCFKEVTTSLKGWKKKFFSYTVVPFRMRCRGAMPPPRHLLYVCGLTMACRHPNLRYDIKDSDMNVIDMDTFLKLPNWKGTVPATIPAPEVSKDTPYAERVVIDLSGNTRVSTPPMEVNQPSPPRAHHNVYASLIPDAHSLQSYHHANEDELVGNRYVPDWELRNDLCVCTPRACKELISHLATPAEDEFLRNLSKAEVLSQAYQTLGHSDANLVELDSLRSNFQRVTQDNEEKTQKIILLENDHFGCPSREKELLDMVKDLEKERDEWRATASDQAEVDRKTLVREFIPSVVKRLHTSVEYRKSLAGPVQLCFTAGWLGGHGFGRTEEAIGQILSETENLDIEGSKS